MKENPDEKTVRSEWLQFFAAVHESWTPSQKEIELMKQCFYAGFGACISVTGEISTEDISEQDFCAVLAGFKNEIIEYSQQIEEETRRIVNAKDN